MFPFVNHATTSSTASSSSSSSSSSNTRQGAPPSLVLSSSAAIAASSSFLPQQPRRPTDFIVRFCNVNVNEDRFTKFEKFFRPTSWPKIKHVLAQLRRKNAKYWQRIIRSDTPYFLVNERGESVQIHPPQSINPEALMPDSETGEYCIASETELFPNRDEKYQSYNNRSQSREEEKEEENEQVFRRRHQQPQQQQGEQEYMIRAKRRVEAMEQEAQVLHEESLRLAQALLESSDSNDSMFFDSSEYQRQSDIRRQISAIQTRLDAIQAETHEIKRTINNNDFS